MVAGITMAALLVDIKVVAISSITELLISKEINLIFQLSSKPLSMIQIDQPI